MCMGKVDKKMDTVIKTVVIGILTVIIAALNQDN
jgi:hypothetical protein